MTTRYKQTEFIQNKSTEGNPDRKDVEVIDLDRSDYSISENGRDSIVDGIEYAKYLRRANHTFPILFTSFCTIEVIDQRKNSEIVNAVGHEFLRKPFSDTDRSQTISKISPLNEIQLADIKYNYCGARSALTEGFHILKGNLKATQHDPGLADPQKAESIESLINNFRTELRKNYPDNVSLLNEYDRITGSFDPSSVVSVENIISLNDASLANTIPAENRDAEIGTKNSTWEVLILDDQPNEIKPLTDALRESGIKYHLAGTVAQAKEIINNDLNNYITVAISDYRLFEPTQNGLSRKMQPEQGYDFMIWLGKQDRFTAMVALSGLSTQFLMDSFRKYSVNVKVYSKNNLINHGVGLFLDDIEYLGEYQEDVKNSIPTASNWKYLRPYYIAYKKLPNSDSVENYISEKANEIIESIKNQVELKTHRDKLDKWNRCSDYVIDCNVGDTQTNFDNPKYQIINEENLDSFYCKLINRRVLIYFLLYPIIDKSVLCWLLRNGVVSKNGNLPDEKSHEGNKKQVFNNQALKESDLPINLLLEEKRWLGRMGININGYKVELTNFYSLFDSFFNNYTNANILNKYKDVFIKDKSIKHFKNNIGNFLKEILATEPKSEAESFISKLENIVSKINTFYPNESSLVEIKNTITKCL